MDSDDELYDGSAQPAREVEACPLDLESFNCSIDDLQVRVRQLKVEMQQRSSATLDDRVLDASEQKRVVANQVSMVVNNAPAAAVAPAVIRSEVTNGKVDGFQDWPLSDGAGKGSSTTVHDVRVERKVKVPFCWPNDGILFPVKARAFDTAECVRNDFWKPMSRRRPVVVDGQCLEDAASALLMCRYFVERNHRIVICFTEAKYISMRPEGDQKAASMLDWMLRYGLAVVVPFEKVVQHRSKYCECLVLTARCTGGVIVSNFVNAIERAYLSCSLYDGGVYPVPLLPFRITNGRLTLENNSPGHRFAMASIDVLLTFGDDEVVDLPIIPIDLSVGVNMFLSMKKLCQN